MGPILEYNTIVKIEYYAGCIQSDQTKGENNREESPQSTILPFNLGHIDEPLNCMYISKTIDTHLLIKDLLQLVFLDNNVTNLFCHLCYFL